jgi:tripartite-type tricarboxylate transporter receptor subunit TctC
MRIGLALISAAMLFVSSATARDAATNYPNRTIRIFVCMPPGGGVDTVTRILAYGLQNVWAGPLWWRTAPAPAAISVRRRYSMPSRMVHPVGCAPPSLTINPLLYKTMSFDRARFEPVAILTTVANMLLVQPDFPAKTAQDFIAYFKAHPGAINYASQGIGTISHLTGALLRSPTPSLCTCPTKAPSRRPTISSPAMSV